MNSKRTETVREEITLFGKKVFVYGVRHTRDVSDPQIMNILKFINKTKFDIIFIEKSEDFIQQKASPKKLKKVLSDENEWLNYFLSNGEMGLIILLAFNKNIPVIGFDMSPVQEIKQMVQNKNVSLDSILLYHGLLLYRNYCWITKNQTIHESFEKLFEKITNDFKSVYPEYDSSYSNYQRLINCEKSKLGSFNDVYNYNLSHSYNTAGAISSELRESYFLKRIRENLKEYEKPIVFTGNSHAKKIMKLNEVEES
jgi:hypothetical protein